MACRFVNDVLHIRESEKDSFWGLPVEWSHRKVVIVSLSDGELFLEVSKTIELVASIEFLVVLSVTAFYLAIMPWRVRPDQLMPNTELFQRFLKQSRFGVLAVCQTVCKLKSIICLDALNRVWELLCHILQKLCGRIGALLFVCL